MRISDWSSDVCSSDLWRHVHQAVLAGGDGDERTEVHQLDHLAPVDAARLDVGGDLLDAVLGGLAGGGVDRGGGDGAVVQDVAMVAGFPGYRRAHLTRLADSLPELVGVGLYVE